MSALIPGLPDLPALRSTIAETLKAYNLLGTYTFPEGDIDDAIAVEGMGHDAGEESYPPAGTQVEGLEVVIIPAEDMPIVPTLDGYIQTYRHLIVLKQHDNGQNKTLPAFHLLKQALGNIFSGSAIRVLPNPRLNNVETLSFSLEQVVLIECDDFDGFDVIPTPTPTPTPSTNEFEKTFTQADLSVAGILPVNHGLSTYPSGVAVYDNTGEEINPDRVEVLTNSTIAIDLSSYSPISGTWRISITG